MDDDHIFKALKIPTDAIEMRAAIIFLYKEKDCGILLDSCMEQSLKQINKFIANERKKRLEDRRITKSEFLRDFIKNKKSALEDLFQEPLNQVKIDLVPNNPERIFTIHSMQPVDIRLMNFLLHL